MIPQSLKALDLLRDPRAYVHALVTAKEGSPEFKLAGRAEVLEDESLRTKLDDLFWEMIEWRRRDRRDGLVAFRLHEAREIFLAWVVREERQSTRHVAGAA